MATQPCPCSGCSNGRHTNGKSCRYCSGKGFVFATDFTPPCWDGYGSDDPPPTSTIRRSTTPRPASSRQSVDSESSTNVDAAHERYDELFDQTVEARAAAKRSRDLLGLEVQLLDYLCDTLLIRLVEALAAESATASAARDVAATASEVRDGVKQSLRRHFECDEGALMAEREMSDLWIDLLCDLGYMKQKSPSDE